ncbi:DUF427 domain-containing protein [Thiothrix nivea]|uniref:DUF427 domain-containing protein n=1 Tax=Thiothrix nivea (strain ATCC 35100 / DSM 5205 / JP2) TaxID=870187 RepID=A0A656HLP8_THINJ|nr:DUF427 domain-containing protein [Thiothrix nivea]EIJ36250.1 protein of unknown function DUF427 [Thiothrix nivea DSM 5205]
MSNDNNVRPADAGATCQDPPSAWEQSCPPSLIPENRTIEVYLGDTLIARSNSIIRVVGGPGAPVTFYLPRKDVRTQYLQSENEGGHCQWRGDSCYYTIDTGARTSSRAACHYANPSAAFVALSDHVCFHPARVACYIDGERVWSQRDDRNGSWITAGRVCS